MWWWNVAQKKLALRMMENGTSSVWGLGSCLIALTVLEEYVWNVVVTVYEIDSHRWNYIHHSTFLSMSHFWHQSWIQRLNLQLSCFFLFDFRSTIKVSKSSWIRGVWSLLSYIGKQKIVANPSGSRVFITENHCRFFFPRLFGMEIVYCLGIRPR